MNKQLDMQNDICIIGVKLNA